MSVREQSATTNVASHPVRKETAKHTKCWIRQGLVIAAMLGTLARCGDSSSDEGDSGNKAVIHNDYFQAIEASMDGGGFKDIDPGESASFGGLGDGSHVLYLSGPGFVMTGGQSFQVWGGTTMHLVFEFDSAGPRVSCTNCD